MSAEVIAGDLGLDLCVVDLSSVVDKYIGETEKNLERIFTEAAGVNGILLFDEADAIFGKRSEAKDCHDRNANMESAYLLQRMESFDGIAVLTTNLRSNLDEALIRRLDVIVDFPVPAPSLRRALRAVPPAPSRDPSRPPAPRRTGDGAQHPAAAARPPPGVPGGPVERGTPMDGNCLYHAVHQAQAAPRTWPRPTHFGNGW